MEMDGSAARETSAKDPTPQTTTDPARAAVLFEQSAAIMARLRAPGGCPWDREQSFDSIRKYTLEEVYEVFDAIERRDFPTILPKSLAICSCRCSFMPRWRPTKAASPSPMFSTA
jgi:hypothetical protein